MDVTLPSGQIIEGVPEGTPKDEIKRRAIAAGLATEADFAPPQSQGAQADSDVPMAPGEPGYEEWSQSFGRQEPKPERSALDVAKGVGETALTMGTGATLGTFGQVVGTLEGLAKEIASGEYGSQEAANRIQDLAMKYAASMTYEPKGEAGREYTQAIGEAAEPLAALTPLTAEITGAMTAATMRPRGGARPQQGQALQAVDDLVPEQVPAKVVPGSKGEADIIRAVEAGGKSKDYVMNPKAPEMAALKLKNGVAVSDPIAKQALTQGVDPGLVSMIKTTSPETKRRMAAMLEVVKRGKKDLRYQDQVRPWDVVGRSMGERIKDIQRLNKAAGQEVNEAVKGLNGFVDYTPAIDSFLDDLAAHGVTVYRDSSGKIKPEFAQSTFRSSRVPQRIINDLIKHLDTDNPVDARQVHIAKKYIDELVHYGKNVTGNAGQVEGVAKKLRANLNQVLGDAFPEYRVANTKYSETLNMLDDAAKSTGVKVPVDSPEFAGAVGTGMRRLLSNAQSKSQLSSVVNNIDDLAGKYGLSYADDIRDQVSFANQLDGLFGPSAKTSLAGEVAKPIDRVAEVALGQKTMMGMAAEGAQAGYKALRGINEDNAIRSLEVLLRENYVTP